MTPLDLARAALTRSTEMDIARGYSLPLAGHLRVALAEADRLAAENADLRAQLDRANAESGVQREAKPPLLAPASMPTDAILRVKAVRARIGSNLAETYAQLQKSNWDVEAAIAALVALGADQATKPTEPR